MKDCGKIHPLLSPYLDKLLSARENLRVEGHLKACAEARLELDHLRRLRERMVTLPAPKFPTGLHDKIMARIQGHPLPSVHQRPFWFVPAGALALAASITMILFVQNPDLFTFNNRKNPSMSPEKEEPVAVSQPPAPAAPAQAQKDQNKAVGSNNGAALPAPMAPSAKRSEKKSKKASAPSASSPFAPEVDKTSGLKEEAQASASNNNQAVLATPSGAPRPPVAESAAAPAVVPTPNPTEGALLDISFSKKISASTWTGVNAPVTVESEVLLTDAESFNQQWQALRPGETIPSVDFTSQAVVFLAAGMEPTTGYSIHVVNLEENPGQLVIHYKVETPSPGAANAQVLTHPWTLQVIPKPTKPVLFQKD